MPGMNKTAKNKIIVASTVGLYHKNKGLKSQDYFAFSQTKNRIVAIVSDGAGSAKYGRIGAKCICETATRILSTADLKQLKQNIINSIESSRDILITHRLNKSKNENGLLDFAATVVGVVIEKDKDKGLFFHIGDGAGIALKGKSTDSYIISEPENGIFSSETYFYTMDDWKDSLRFTPFKNATDLFLMTDGVTGFALKKDEKSIEKGFILPIEHYLQNETDTKRAERALKNTLETPKACAISKDDKTLMWIKLK